MHGEGLLRNARRGTAWAHEDFARTYALKRPKAPPYGDAFSRLCAKGDLNPHALYGH